MVQFASREIVLWHFKHYLASSLFGAFLGNLTLWKDFVSMLILFYSSSSRKTQRKVPKRIESGLCYWVVHPCGIGVHGEPFATTHPPNGPQITIANSFQSMGCLLCLLQFFVWLLLDHFQNIKPVLSCWNFGFVRSLCQHTPSLPTIWVAVHCVCVVVIRWWS